MKFVIAAIVMFAVAFSAQASILPLGIDGTSVIAPNGIATIAGAISPSIALAQTPTIISAPAPAIALAQGPAILAAPAPIAIHTPTIVAAQGSYIAKTRGAIHTAPLAGHLNSAASINLEPAPGTI